MGKAVKKLGPVFNFKLGPVLTLKTPNLGPVFNFTAQIPPPPFKIFTGIKHIFELFWGLLLEILVRALGRLPIKIPTELFLGSGKSPRGLLPRKKFTGNASVKVRRGRREGDGTENVMTERPSHAQWFFP